MPFEDLLGRSAKMIIRRFNPSGAYLAEAEPPLGDNDEILLPGAEIPEGAQENETLDVFVYLDSEARPIATTRKPKLERGDVAFLEVTDCTRFGAFFDWGLPKELLVPFAEQTSDVSVGSRHPVGLYLDDRGRLTGTMRVSEMLDLDDAEFERDEWVEGEAWRNDPDIGLFVIVERAYVGLLPASEPHSLPRGAAARFRVSKVLPDGKIELSLRGHAHEELETDARTILEVLARPGAPKVGDRSSPEQIRALFGLSKKAFKRGVGRLLKERSIVIQDDGTIVPVTR